MFLFSYIWAHGFLLLHNSKFSKSTYCSKYLKWPQSSWGSWGFWFVCCCCCWFAFFCILGDFFPLLSNISPCFQFFTALFFHVSFSSLTSPGLELDPAHPFLCICLPCLFSSLLFPVPCCVWNTQPAAAHSSQATSWPAFREPLFSTFPQRDAPSPPSLHILLESRKKAISSHMKSCMLKPAL